MLQRHRVHAMTSVGPPGIDARRSACLPPASFDLYASAPMCVICPPCPPLALWQDPHPDIHALFVHYNSLYFDDQLGACSGVLRPLCSPLLFAPAAASLGTRDAGRWRSPG